MLTFWRQRAELPMPAAEIARELSWGEDVEGLLDLPVRDILDRLKAAFPRHRETSGLLTIHAASGTCDVTWSWQHVRVECHGISSEEQLALVEILKQFGCAAHEG